MLYRMLATLINSQSIADLSKCKGAAPIRVQRFADVHKGGVILIYYSGNSFIFQQHFVLLNFENISS